MKDTVKLRRADFLSDLDPSKKTCLYCYKSFRPFGQMIRHVKSVHMGHTLELGKYTTVLCKRSCQGEENILAHYHCPECDVTNVKRERLRRHFEMNHITRCLLPLPTRAEMSKVKNTVKLTSADFLAEFDASRKTCLYCYKNFSPLNEMIRHVKSVHLGHTLQLGKYTTILCKRACQGKQKIEAHYHCPECDVTNAKKERLQKHFETNHIKRCLPSASIRAEAKSSLRDRCKLADASSGIYIVSKCDFGIDHPIHVMKRTSSESSVVKCSDRACQEFMALGRKNSIFDLQCQHLERVKAVEYEVDDWHNSYEVPANFSEQDNNIFHMYMSTIIRLEKIPVVQWEANERYKYFSVFSNDKPNSNFERIFVSHDSKHQKFKCRCLNQKRTGICAHIILVKVFCNSKNISLAEKNKNEPFPSFNMIESEAEYQRNEAVTSFNMIESKVEYQQEEPVTSFNMIESESEYQLNNSKYPDGIPLQHRFKTKEALRKLDRLEPSETSFDEEGNVIRERNANLVRWSDGSLSMHLGGEIFDVDDQPLPGDHNHLSIPQGTALQGQAVFRTTLTFRPYSTDSFCPDSTDSFRPDSTDSFRPDSTDSFRPDSTDSFRPHSTDSFTHEKILNSLGARSLNKSHVKVLARLQKHPDSTRGEVFMRGVESFKASPRRSAQQKKVKTSQGGMAGLTKNYLQEDDNENSFSIATIKSQANTAASSSTESVYSDASDVDSREEKFWMPAVTDSEDEKLAASDSDACSSPKGKKLKVSTGSDSD